MTRTIAILFLAVLLCGAKATSGKDFTEENLPRLQVGQTSLTEAIELLGRTPDTTQAGRSGAVGYTWTYASVKSSVWTGRASSNVKSVILVFNPDGTFQRIFSLHGITLPTADMQRLVTKPAAAATATPQ